MQSCQESPDVVRTARAGFFAALSLGTLTASVSGQGQSPPVIPIDAPIVHLDVVVTDRQGRPVRQLSATDFELYVDDRETPLAAFHAPAPTLANHAGESRAGVAERAAGARAVSSVPSTFVVYVDNWNLTPAGRARVLSDLSPVLTDQVTRYGTRVIVVSASAEARVLSPLTADPERVAAALRAVQQEPTHRQITRSEERHAIDTLRAQMESGSGGCEDLMLLQAPIRFQAAARSRELESTLERLDRLIGALGTLAGSKALFYVSEGLEQRPAIDLFHQLGDICPTAYQTHPSVLFAPMEEYDLSRAMRALAARANAARVAFYPLDGSGLGATALSDPSWDNRLFVPSATTTAIRVQNLKSGQGILADETGGAALFDANDLHQPLVQLVDQLHGAYALGFTPDHEPEGRVHSLRVVVKRKGLRARSMPSYFHGARAEPHAARTLAALVAGVEQDSLGAEVSVDPPAASDPAAGGTRRVRVRVTVPLAALSAVEDAGGRHGRLRVLLAIRRVSAAARTEPVELRENTFDVPLSAEPHAAAAGERHEVVVEVPLGAEEREIAVGVQDAISQLATYRLVRAGP